jgi:hypothetical protein
LRREASQKLTDVSGACFLNKQDDDALIVKEVSVSEASVTFYQTPLRKIPEDSHLHSCFRENLNLTRPSTPTSFNAMAFVQLTVNS